MAPPQEERYTYADLLSWDTEVRYELYDGYPVALASPSDVHQEISGELYLQLRENLKGKRCKAYYAPLDVQLFAEKGDDYEDVDTVLQPDLMVVCDPEKIDRRGVKGAPDFIIEILSPGTERYDRITKFHLYRRAGVREYWIVNPEVRSVETFTLRDGEFIARVFSEEDKVPVSLFEDFQIDLAGVFPEEEGR